jgi:uncharacterized protein YlxP (DUF503 family)
MLLASLRLTLRLYESASLKEKRFVLSSVKRRLRNRFNVSVSEIGLHESHREAEVGIVTVAREKKQADREIEAVTRFLDRDGRFEVVDRLQEYF